MGCIDTITYDKFPKQKDKNYKYPQFKVGSRVEVCYHFDASKCHYGTIVRDDLDCRRRIISYLTNAEK